MGARPAAGGGRWVDVAPERLGRWLENFAARNGDWTADGLTLTAANGTTAVFEAPPGAERVPDMESLATTAAAPRTLGLLLARKGAIAVGVAEGAELAVSKVDTHYVQGRTAAGGWSQQRFARRRANQARAATADGAGITERVLLPRVREIAALITGGDRTAVDAILAAPELKPLLAKRADRFLEVPEPRHAVLVEAIAAARAVRVLLKDP